MSPYPYHQPARRSSGNAFAVVLGALLLAAIVGGLGVGIVHSRHEQTCTVEDKDRTRNRDGGSDARVYTTDCGVLTVKDSLWAGTWHSADTYAAIKPGHTYVFTVQGWRIPFLSHFPNIIDAQESK